MRFKPLPSKFHAANRAALAKTIGDDAVAIIDTADVLTRPGDFEYPFRPDSNFYYLTGIAEPEAVLVLVPGHSNPGLRELLFVSGTSEYARTWEGERHTLEQAGEISGITATYPLSELESLLERLLPSYPHIYMNAEESLKWVRSSPSMRRASRLRQSMPLHELHSVLPQLARRRMIKQPLEVDEIRKAISITHAGLQAALAALKPGLREYELEAEITAEFTRRGSGHAYPPIVASGPASTVLHYVHADGKVGKDDVVLFDIGAESGYYAADISRTVHASGRFTGRQRAVHEGVHRVQQSAIALLKPGLMKRDFEDKVSDLLLVELEKLGLMSKRDAGDTPDTRVSTPDVSGPTSPATASDSILRKYYPHATSHFLGLDVHDAGDYSVPLAPGMVITVEPGIYIRDERIGVRVEDDVLITETGSEVLSAGVPSNAADMEAMMASGPRGSQATSHEGAK